MLLTKDDTLKKMLDAPELYVLYNATIDMTKQQKQMPPVLLAKTPLLFEAPRTFQIQAWIYDSKEAVANASKTLFQSKILAMGVRFDQKSYPSMLMNLMEYGAEHIVFHSGEDAGEVSLTEEEIKSLTESKEVSELVQGQRNLSRDLVLFSQQLSRNLVGGNDKIQPGDKEKERAYYNKMAGSLMRGALLVPVQRNPKAPDKLTLPIFGVKDAKGNITEKQLLAFINPLELNRQFGEKVPECQLLNLSDIKHLLDQFADSLVINRATSGIRITKQGVEQILNAMESMDAVERGEKEPDATSVKNHLLFDEMLYTVHTAQILSMKNGQTSILQPRNPYIVEDPETFNDQSYVFASLEDARKYVEQIRDEKKSVLVVRSWPARTFDVLITTLLSKSVNSVVYVRNQKSFELDLNVMGKLPDFSDMDEKNRPLLNPTLGLCAQYYWQELNRTVRIDDRSDDEKELLMDKASEFIANIKKSTFYMRYIFQDKEGKKVPAFPMATRQDADGKVISSEYQLFSDIYELDKYFGGAKQMVLKVPFQGLRDLLMDSCTGIVLDPAGVEFHIGKSQLQAILADEL